MGTPALALPLAACCIEARLRTLAAGLPTHRPAWLLGKGMLKRSGFVVGRSTTWLRYVCPASKMSEGFCGAPSHLGWRKGGSESSELEVPKLNLANLWPKSEPKSRTVSCFRFPPLSTLTDPR